MPYEPSFYFTGLGNVDPLDVGVRLKISQLRTEVAKREIDVYPVKADQYGLPKELRIIRGLAELLLDVGPLGKVYETDQTPYSSAELEQVWTQINERKFYLDNRQAVDDNINDVLKTIVKEFSSVPQVEMSIAVSSLLGTEVIYLVPDPRATLNRVWNLFVDSPQSNSIAFRSIKYQLKRNVQPLTRNEKYDLPGSSNLPLAEVIETYFADTPLLRFLLCPVGIEWTQQQRFSHTQILGGSGAGKTTLLKRIIQHDIRGYAPGTVSPAIIVVDPHSDISRDLRSGDIGVEEKIIIIDPRDLEYPVAINIFALNQKRLNSYSATMREQVTNSVLQTFDYFFTGLLGTDLTPKQGILFRYVTRLMLTFPDTLGRNATILDMLTLMDDPSPYLGAIGALPAVQLQFFEEFLTPKNATWRETKDQIRYRLQGLLESPTLSRFLTAPETKLDLFEEMNNGSIIVIDTAKDFLRDGSSMFGRIFISLVLQAVLERAVIPEQDRRPAFLYVDEAASYFDSNIDDLLTEARKFRCGCTFSFQKLEDATPKLRASLASNTASKFVSGVSSSDARAMATDMRTTPEFILSQPKHQFAAYLSGVTPHAVPVPVWKSWLSELASEPDSPKRAALMAKSRERVSFGPPKVQQTTHEPPPKREAWYRRPRPSPPVPTEKDDDDW